MRSCSRSNSIVAFNLYENVLTLLTLIHNSLVQDVYRERKNVYRLRIRKREIFYVDLQATRFFQAGSSAGSR